MLSLFIPDSERKALEGEISKRYRALYNDGRFGKVVEFYNLASPKFLSMRGREIATVCIRQFGRGREIFEVAGKLYKSNPDSIEIQEIYINAKIDSTLAKPCPKSAAHFLQRTNTMPITIGLRHARQRLPEI
ncbi:MAG: hypothetical protein ACLUKN_03190 [Bacilli bacterium]